MNAEEKLPRTQAARIGYRNPPQHTWFKKGQSGNPKGWPKGSLNLVTVLARTLREKVVINEHGQRRVVTKLEAAIKRLVNKAAAGDLAALRHLARLVQSAEDRATETPSASGRFSEDDPKVVQGTLERLGNAKVGDDTN